MLKISLIFDFLTFFDFLESILPAIWDYSGRMLEIETPPYFEVDFCEKQLRNVEENEKIKN